MRTHRPTARMPAECWPPSEFVKEEMEARGWTPDMLAAAIKWQRDFLDAFLTGEVELTEQMAQDLSAGFGTSHQFWLNLERTYYRWLRHPKRRAWPGAAGQQQEGQGDE